MFVYINLRSLEHFLCHSSKFVLILLDFGVCPIKLFLSLGEHLLIIVISGQLHKLFQSGLGFSVLGVFNQCLSEKEVSFD